MMEQKKYIERDAAKEAIDTPILHDGIRDALKSCIDDVPAADVRPVVRGRWIRRQSWSEGIGMGESYGFYYDCSVCNRTVKGDFDGCSDNFCPNCGADMREEL